MFVVTTTTTGRIKALPFLLFLLFGGHCRCSAIDTTTGTRGAVGARDSSAGATMKQEHHQHHQQQHHHLQQQKQQQQQQQHHLQQQQLSARNSVHPVPPQERTEELVTLHVLKQYLNDLEDRLERQHRAALDAVTAAHAAELQALEERMLTHCAQQQQQAASKHRHLQRSSSSLSSKQQRQSHRSLKKTKLELALGCVDLKRSNKKNLYFKGCNVWIQNGKGKTQHLNGQGNLILGYNEKINCITSANCVRSGSHNLIAGPNHEYASYGGIVGGDTNSAIGIASTVPGGTQGEAQGNYSSVTGGYFGWAAGDYSSVTAGDNGAAFGIYAAVHGGFYNTASGGWSSILGGDYNYATNPATSATITGGQENHVESSYGTIHGGLFNFVQSKYGVILGGQNNTIGPGFDANYTTLPPIIP